MSGILEESISYPNYNMYDIYPATVGTYLVPKVLDQKSIRLLVKSMPKHCIIHLYGLSFVGCSEVGSILTKFLEADTIDEDLIVRAIAYQITQKKDWYDKHLFEPYFEVLSFLKDPKKTQVVLENISIPQSLLKTKKVKILAQKLMDDEKFLTSLNKYISMAFAELHDSRVVITSHRALPHYLSDQKQVIHILLTTDEDTRRDRYYQTRTEEYRYMNKDFEATTDVYDLIEQEYTKLVQDNDELIIARSIQSGEGLVVEPGYVINTTRVMVDTVVGTILSELYQLYA
jgi:cytidylate kinase